MSEELDRMSAKIDSIVDRVDAETTALNGWYGDIFTAAEVDWDKTSFITQARLVHAHDISTGECKKNRAGYRCS